VRSCPNCGTEVDETAVFCPTCGQPVDQAVETDMPAAPAWPEPSDAPAARTQEPPARPDVRPREADATTDRSQTPAPAAPDSSGSAASAGPLANVPLTIPVTLSGWLIGIGALIAVLGIVIGLFDGVLNPIELILLVALVGIGAAVFFSASLSGVPNLRLATLVISLIGFGFALNQLGSGGAGAGELLLFLGTAAAAIGAIIAELGRDQPLGPAR
jgi:hypothetical protein